MNHFKNFVIFVFSVIILVESLFLLRLLSQRKPALPKEARRVIAVREKKALAEVKPPAPQKGVMRQKPAVIQGQIVLVLDDWGYNLKNKDFITDNNFHVTISVLPFRNFSTDIAEWAHQNHKDVIIHMPMEPKDKENLGLEENTLLTGMSQEKVSSLLEAARTSVPYAKGLSNHMGSKATEDARLMKFVMEYLKKKDLFFLDSLVTSRSAGYALAKKFGVGFFRRDVFLDNASNPDGIRQQMIKLAQKAKELRVAIGIGHDRPNTILVLKEMIPLLEEQGYQFVNLSEAMNSKERK